MKIKRIKSNMITVKLNNLTLKFTFGFFLILALSSLEPGSYAVWSLSFCILHEFAHLSFMIFFHVPVCEIKFYGAGIKIISIDMKSLSRFRKFLIYIGGCLANFLLAVAFSLSNLDTFALINFIICIFNLMPIAHFDGGKIFSMYMNRFERFANVVSVIFSVLVIAVAGVAFAFSLFNEGATMLVCLVFIILCEILE